MEQCIFNEVFNSNQFRIERKTVKCVSEMVSNKFSLIAAACENMGIGINGDLPWRLDNEFAYFNRITTETSDPAKRNVCIMGRKTYSSFLQPLPGRLNVVLSRTSTTVDYPADVLLCASLSEAMSVLHERFAGAIEKVWIVGGTALYKEAMESDRCHRIYLTEIKAQFECDTFFPPIDGCAFELVANDGGVSVEEQVEMGIRYQYKIYEKIA